MGVCYIGAGMYDKAIAYYKEALVYANKNIPKSTLAGKVLGAGIGICPEWRVG